MPFHPLGALRATLSGSGLRVAGQMTGLSAEHAAAAPGQRRPPIWSGGGGGGGTIDRRVRGLSHPSAETGCNRGTGPGRGASLDRCCLSGRRADALLAGRARLRPASSGGECHIRTTAAPLMCQPAQVIVGQRAPRGVQPVVIHTSRLIVLVRLFMILFG